MPPDLTAFAKQFDIQLLTHNDPKGKTEIFISFPIGTKTKLKLSETKIKVYVFLTIKNSSR